MSKGISDGPVTTATRFPDSRQRVSMASQLRYDLRVVWACAFKDIQSSLTERVFTIISIILPINFLLLFLLFVLTGGQAPTAVVMEEHGPYAQQFVRAMEQAHSFTLTPPGETTAAHAKQLLQHGEIVAIVTVPASFDTDLQAGRALALPVTINNLDVDFTNDIRRAVPLAITSFYATAFPDQVVVQAHEVDVHGHDTGYIPYLAVSIIVIALMVGGLLQAGTNAAREYETGTIKELLLSPASRWAIEGGKVLGALILNTLSVVLILAVVVGLLGIQPLHWAELIAFVLLLMLIFCTLGVLAGTLTRRRTAVVPLSLGLALPLFFVSGAFGPVSWGSQSIAFVARGLPVYYGIAVLQHAFHDFRTTATSQSVNILVLLGFTVLAIGLSTFQLRRSSLAH